MDKNHQYYTLAATMYPRLVNGLLQSGRINQMEANWLLNKCGGPEFNQFVQNVIAQFPCLAGEGQMEKLMYDNFFSQLIAYARQCSNPNMMMPGAGVGAYGGGGVPLWGAPGGGMRFGNPGPMYGGGGMMGAGAGSGWYTGGRRPQPMFNARPPMTPMAGHQPQQKKEPPKPEPAKKQPVKWTEPVLNQEANAQITNNNGTEFQYRQFTSVDGAPLVELFVSDARPIYKNPDEAIASFKNLVGDERQTHKFLTVCYRELKLVRADRKSMFDLIKACSTSAGNYPATDAAGRLRAIISVSADHPAGAVKALHQLIVDEFNDHVCCGELVDAVQGHIDWKVTVSNVESIHAMLTGNIDKSIRDALKQVKDFDKTLQSVVTKVINTLVLNGAAQKILDPIKDRSIIDVYGRVVPPIWRNETTATWEATPNFFTKYLASMVKSNGSKPDSAVQAEQSLRTALVNADRNYCVMQVPRIITWCNYPSSSIVGWNESGKCIPGVFMPKGFNSDVAFLLNRTVARIKASKLADFADVPKQLICEVDEGRIRIDYGLTTDGGLWCGSMRYRED